MTTWLLNGKNHLTGLALLGITACLCISVTFVPESTRTAEDISSEISLYRSSGDHFAVIPLTADDGIRRSKPDKSQGQTRKSSTYGEAALSSAQIFRCKPSSGLVLEKSDSVSRRKSRQACQLLDKPPPSFVASL